VEHCTFLTELLHNKQVARLRAADRESPFSGQSNQTPLVVRVAENLRVNPVEGYPEGAQRNQKPPDKEHPAGSCFHKTTGLAINKRIRKPRPEVTGTASKK